MNVAMASASTLTTKRRENDWRKWWRRRYVADDANVILKNSGFLRNTYTFFCDWGNIASQWLTIEIWAISCSFNTSSVACFSRLHFLHQQEGLELTHWRINQARLMPHAFSFVIFYTIWIDAIYRGNRAFIRCSTYPRWKIGCLSQLNNLHAHQNVSGYIWDSCRWYPRVGYKRLDTTSLL